MKKITFFVLFVLAVAIADVAAYAVLKQQNLKQQKDFSSKITILQKQISAVESDLVKVASSSGASLLPLQEIANRQQVIQKSQDQLLTAAVAKNAPSVVSIVISKDVPQYEVTYVNPFGDDPFFQDFGAQMPVYKQTGTVQQKVGAGTGFIITSDGYILTNKHVVSDDQAAYTVLLSNGKQLPAKVVYKDFSNDAAIVKIDGSGYAPVALGDSGALQLGETVIAIGNALGEYNNSVSVGIVSGLNRSIEAQDSGGNAEQLSGVVQTDAAINPGNSGGPLLNLNGEVVGVNVATVSGSQNIGFSLPVNVIKPIIKTVLGK
jgi:serine protease Do